MSQKSDVENKALLDRLNKLRMDQNASNTDDEMEGEMDLVTLMQNKCGDGVYDPSSRFSHLEGFQYARSRGRRKSKEFEDLLIHTATGSLRMSRQSILLRPKTPSHKHHFDTLPNPHPRPKPHGDELHSKHHSPKVRPKRPLLRSKSDLSDRLSFRDKLVKSVGPRGQSPQTGSRKPLPPSPGSPVLTSGSPKSKRSLKDKENKTSSHPPGKHQSVK